MADLADKAADVLQRMNHGMSKLKLPEANDTTECIDCGDDIPQERKNAVPHAVRCAFCAHVVEGNK